MSNTYKVVLLGEGRVGKTSLISRFVKDKFDSEEASTVQANMYNKKKVSVDGRAIDLSIWDTAGQERFHALGPIYYRNSNGAVLVYDITDADTFEKVKMWIKELKAVVGDSISIVICGNKADMERDRDIDEAIAQKYATKESALHFNTSARGNMNVTEAFEALAKAMIAAQEGAQGGGGGGGGSSTTRRKKKGGLQIDESGAGDADVAAGRQTSEKATSSSSAPKSSSAANDDPYSYDSYDKPAPAAAPAAAATTTASSSGKPPRKNTIVLSSTNMNQQPSGGGSSSDNSGSGRTSSSPTTDKKKSSGKCCS
jgi:small GTP-binding protein